MGVVLRPEVEPIAAVNVRGWSAAVMSFELDSKLVTPLLSQEIADGLQFSCSRLSLF